MQNDVFVSFETLPHSPITNYVQYKLMKENMFKVNELHFITRTCIMYNNDEWKMVMADYILLNDFKINIYNFSTSLLSLVY